MIPNDHRSQWFQEEVSGFDSVLRAYVRNSFPSVRDVDDVVQESYLRIWKARANGQIRFPKAFLFTVARNVARDLVRRGRVSPIDEVERVENVVAIDESAGSCDALVRGEKIRFLAQVIAQLPPRCREVFVLHKIKGLSRKEVGARLGLSERTVEVQTARAMKRCSRQLKRGQFRELSDPPVPRPRFEIAPMLARQLEEGKSRAKP